MGGATGEKGDGPTPSSPARFGREPPRRPFSPSSPALRHTVIATCSTTGARASVLDLPHGRVRTPVFMPVGTQGTLKGLDPTQIGPDSGAECKLMLGNTYHLGARPGPDLLRDFGGLHRFMRYRGNLLTDSGGFQMVSLLALADIDERGVWFQNPHDGTRALLTPERSMEIQNCIGADVMMALDDVVSSTVTGPRVEEAMERTLRWIDRCVAAHARPTEQNLFGIVQGGLDASLRARCLEELVRRDLPGYAIGGLSGGEDKEQFWPIVAQCARALPRDRPRYLMGVGYPVDLVVCVALGCDMFDCVYPTRTARFGTALVRRGGLLNLRLARYASDLSAIEPGCTCATCAEYSRAALYSLFSAKSNIGGVLVTVHNVHFQLATMAAAREAIVADRFPQFVREFVADQYPRGAESVPKWARDALASVNIEINHPRAEDADSLESAKH